VRAIFRVGAAGELEQTMLLGKHLMQTKRADAWTVRTGRQWNKQLQLRFFSNIDCFSTYSPISWFDSILQTQQWRSL